MKIELREGTKSASLVSAYKAQAAGSVEEIKGGRVKKPAAYVKLDGQEKMTLPELEQELEGAVERNEIKLQISLLETILKKAFGPKKIEFMKQLVNLFQQTNKRDKFMELAPQVLKLDANNYELRIELLKILISNVETMPQAQTEMHRLDA